MLRFILFFFALLMKDFLVALQAISRRAAWRARGVRISRGALLRAHSAQAIYLASGSSVGYGTLLIATTEHSDLPAQMSFLHIGERTTLNEYCNIRASGGSIEIGRDCLIAQMVSIVASNHSMAIGRPIQDQPWDKTRNSVCIGDDVWIGAGVTVLPGTRIESGSIVAAGAIVRGHVPANEIWGGVPAKFLKKRG